MRRLPREGGAAAVEFALVLPVLALLIVGIMEFGYAFFIQASVAGAARFGVRNYVIEYPNGEPSARSAAIAMAKSATPDPNLAMASITRTCVSSTDETSLIITYRYPSLTGFLDSFLGSTVTITGKGTMQCGG